MKKKKISPITPTILISFCIIALVFTFLPKNPPPSSSQLSSTSPTPLAPRSLGEVGPNHISPPSDSLFSKLLKPKTSNLTTLIAVGDIMLGRYVNVKMVQYKDFKYPFLKTASLTSNADITFGNLEAPIVADCPTTETGMIFCARPEAIAGLKLGGFDVLSVSNNHALNQGREGLAQTKLLLEKNGISFSDSNKPVIKTINGIKFGYISFDLVTYPSPRFAGEAGQTPLISQISLIAPTVDILVVSLHWGNEYQKTPTSQQKQLAHQIIDNGAKIVIGHHPHVTQPEEKYKNGLIFYSLGNFIFDQPWSEETKKGNIAKIVFEGKEIKSYEIIPIYIEDYCQPKLLQ